MTELVHWQTTWTYADHHRLGAACYWRHPVSSTTADVFAVTCGKCQRRRDFKDAAAAAF